MRKLKILIADDHAVVRTGLMTLLGVEKDIVIVGQARNGEEAVALAQSEHPDVVVMDLVMPKMDGVEATRKIRAHLPDCKVAILTSFGTSDDIAHALEAGATGALMKSAEDTELVDALRRIAAGERVIAPEIRQMLEDEPPVPELTPRQKDVLASLTHGLTNRDIARQLGIREDGVNLHIIAILQKLGAANRTEAVAIALRKHLLKI